MISTIHWHTGTPPVAEIAYYLVAVTGPNDTRQVHERMWFGDRWDQGDGHHFFCQNVVAWAELPAFPEGS